MVYEKTIFDDGKGIDRLGTKKDGLKFQWKWLRVCELSWAAGDPQLKDKRRLPCQVCFADVGNFRYKVVAWHDHYEACVEYYREEIVDFNKELDDDTIEYKGKVLLERIQAQQKAESLLMEYYKMIGLHLKKYGFKK